MGRDFGLKPITTVQLASAVGPSAIQRQTLSHQRGGGGGGGGGGSGGSDGLGGSNLKFTCDV